MTSLFETYTDSDFLVALSSLLPAVGVGVVLAAFMVIIGLLIGFLVRAGSDSY